MTRHVDAEEIYYQLERYLKEQGYELTDEADGLLDDLARSLAEQTSDADDPHAHWQTFSPSGNATMEQMYQKLVADIKSGEVNRLQLPGVIAERLNTLVAFNNQGYTDTEPRMELIKYLNPVLDEYGYKALDYFDV